jgi:hypothetical protein
MRTAFSLAFSACLLAALPAYGEELTGRVRAIYYEAAGGVLVEPRMLRRPSAVRWVDVELDGERRVLVQLPSSLDAGVGDIVAVQLAAPKSMIAVAEPIRVSRVTEVKAHGTQLATPAR